MTDKEIIKGNVLIAKFMGFHNILSNASSVLYNGKKQTHWFAFPEHLYYRKDLWDTEESVVDQGNGELMKFHSSWDWLMPVIKKCLNIDYEVCINIFEIYSFLNNNIQALWHNVIYFIEWYNERTKNEIL